MAQPTVRTNDQAGDSRSTSEGGEGDPQHSGSGISLLEWDEMETNSCQELRNVEIVHSIQLNEIQWCLFAPKGLPAIC